MSRWGVLIFPSTLVFAAMAQSPGEPNVLRYTVTADPFEIELTLPGGAKQKRQLPRQPHYFVHPVNVRWPIPDWPDDKLVRCEIRWIGFPAEFRLINSYDMDSRHQVFETTIPKLRKAVFAGGELRAGRSPNGHYLVTQGEWKFSDAQLLERIDRIVTQHTAVWKDEGLPDHRVFLFPRDGSWAGVRDGQRWKPFDVVWGDPAYEIGIEIEDEQGKRRVRYYPAATNAVAAPQYKAAAGSCNPDTFRLAPR